MDCFFEYNRKFIIYQKVGEYPLREGGDESNHYI